MHLINRSCQFKVCKDDKSNFVFKSMLFSKFAQAHAWGGRVVRWGWVNFQSRGVLLILIRVGQGPTVLAVGAGGGC